MNREQWLTEVAERLLPYYRRKGYYPKQFRLTCGWPCRGALASRRRRLGECHSGTTSRGGISEVFISPLVDDGIEVAGIVAHELIHVALGTKEGHGGKFRQAMRHLGLVGKPTSAEPGKELKERIAEWTKDLGTYPHQALQPAARRVAKPGADVRLVCGECGCRVSMSRKWYEEAGTPTCGCGGRFNEVGKG